MYYIIKEDTLGQVNPDFVTGGFGVDYRDPNETIRHITNDIDRALVFDTIEDAKQFLIRGFVVVTQIHGSFKQV